nr:aldo-keto reductase yakc [nadp(+)] [Quercus suber]
MQQAGEILSEIVGGSRGHMLPTAKLGRHGPEVTRLGYGTMGLSAFYGKPKPDAERFAVLDKVYAKGDLFWDTADIYQDSEDLLGAWFKQNPGKREKIFLATKFANRFNQETGAVSVDSTPEYCRQACETSLRRLGVSHIDLYYAHRLDGKTPVEKTMQELKKLKQEGKIKYIGLSECSSDSLQRACSVEHVDAVQIEYSPFSLDIESPQIGLLKTARELGVAVVAYSPIGRGMLGGSIRSPDDFEDNDFRKNAPRFSKENFPKNLQLVDTITAIAKKKDVTASQLTLAWLLAQGHDIFPIPGTTNLDRVDENLGALHIKLSKEDELEIRKACEAAEDSSGASYVLEPVQKLPSALGLYIESDHRLNQAILQGDGDFNVSARAYLIYNSTASRVPTAGVLDHPAFGTLEDVEHPIHWAI